MDPARAGKIAGMLLELDVHQRVVPLNVHQIVALIVFPDMVRLTSPKATACTRPPARLRPRCRSYLTASRRRKGCWIAHTLVAAMRWRAGEWMAALEVSSSSINRRR